MICRLTEVDAKRPMGKGVLLSTIVRALALHCAWSCEISVGCTVSGRLEREMLPISLASPSVFGERVKLGMLVSDLMLLVKRRAS